MERESNIFFKLTRENENASSELLCNMLRRKYIRDLVLDFFNIPPEAREAIKLDDISTQKGIAGIGIPDITIENENTFYLIENKIHIDTPLQEKQTTTYVEYIHKINKPHKGYIFLIPEEYSHESEIIASKKLHPGLCIEIYYWNCLLDYLREKEIREESPVINEALDYLDSLVLKKPALDTELNANEVVIMYNTKDLFYTLSLVDKIKILVEKVEKNIVDKLGQNFVAGQTQKDQSGVGKYLKYNNEPSIFYGLNPEKYKESNGDFVYSVSFDKKVLKENPNINKKYSTYVDESYMYIKIDRKIFVDDDQENALINAVVDIIKNVFLKNLR